MLQNFGTALSREQMKFVVGGEQTLQSPDGSCSIKCNTSSGSCTGTAICRHAADWSWVQCDNTITYC